MDASKYQRMIIGYHGCDKSVTDGVLLKGAKLRKSENDYDWLEKGTYFWEHGPERALEWAQASARINDQSVLGAVIHLGNCFDLLDTAHTQLLAKLYPVYRETCQKLNRTIPKNMPSSGEAHGDLLKRHLDCAVINWVLDLLEKRENCHFHTVRCVFSEDVPVYEGSKIHLKSHIQIAVRDPSTIIGYFKPDLTA